MSAAASTGPLELYRLCVNGAKRGWTTAQITLSLVFGERFVALPNSSVPRTKLPVYSPRHRGFRARRRAGTDFQTDVSWDEGTECFPHA